MWPNVLNFWWEPRLIVGAQLKRVSWAARCIWWDLHSWMWWHHKAWCQWMERKYRGRRLKKDDAWVSSWKQKERKWMKDDMVTYSHVNGQCSGICGEASYRVKHLTLAECRRNGRFKNKYWWWWGIIIIWKFRLRQPWLFENECNENLFELSRDDDSVKRQICEVGFETIERAEVWYQQRCYYLVELVMTIYLT